MNQPHKCSYEFGPFRLEKAKRFLLRDGKIVPITPKVFDTLSFLIENGGEVVERGILIQRLWPDSFVEEGNLSYNISILRKALGERPNEHRYIATIPGRGYMFVGDVREVSESIATTNGDNNLKVERSHPAGTTIESVAVLPMTFSEADHKTEYLSDAITENIISNLSQQLQIRVLSRNTVSPYKGSQINAQSAGSELGVRAVLLGRVAQFDNKLIVKAELVDVLDGRQLWGASYSREEGDIFKIEEEISLEISEALNLKLTGKSRRKLTERYTRSPSAYDAYIKGLYHWNRFLRAGTIKAVDYFEQAIKSDPDYALAYAGLSDCYYRLSNMHLSPQEAMPKAKAAAMKAVELDADLAETHTVLAVVKDQLDWDWNAAEIEFKSAIGCNAEYAFTYQRYSRFLARMGRFEEANMSLQAALELEPLSLLMNVSLGSLLITWRRYDESIVQMYRILEMNPNYLPAFFGLAQAYQLNGELDKAVEFYQNALSMDNNYEISCRLGQAYAVSGRAKEAEQILVNLKAEAVSNYVSPYYIALVYSELGDMDNAFTWLEKSFDERSSMLTWMLVHPEWDTLRADTRFDDLMKRVGLPPHPVAKSTHA